MELKGGKGSFNISDFCNPSSEYRGAPFWSWNGDLEPERLIEQIHSMKDNGIGGFFMHSRIGLNTEYMSEQWLKCVKACVKEAGELNMQAWLYDEDSFPSGFAGGKVMERNPDWAAKSLKATFIPQGGKLPDGQLTAVFGLTMENGLPVSYGEYRGGGAGLAFTLELARPDTWHNGYPYVDLLDPEVTKAFIELTHDVYAREVGDAFGDAIPGIFTDEPHIHPGRAAIPWTREFPAYFEERCGYDLTARLPELFLDLGDYKAARNDYWKTVSKRFIESFCIPIYQWCEEHGIAFTGHFWEHEMPSPLASGSIMAPLKYMQVPGIDLLGIDYPKGIGPELPTQVGNYPMVKVAPSVANQFGRKRVLSETYGGGGWDLNLEDQKKIAEWQAVIGINYLNQHLSYYSMVGSRKRDFPLIFNDCQPWFDEYKAVADPLARLYYALSQGVYDADLLVLHPMSSAWAVFRREVGGDLKLPPARQAQEITYSLDAVCKQLSSLGFNFDFGDELILETDGNVFDDGLHVGRALYRTVLIPPSLNMASSTLKLLQELDACGGNIVVVGDVPELLDGRPSAELRDFLCEKAVRVTGGVGSPADLAGLETALCGIASRSVRFDCDQAGIHVYSHSRVTDDCSLHFVANCDEVPAVGELVFDSDSTGFDGTLEILDMNTGLARPAMPDSAPDYGNSPGHSIGDLPEGSLTPAGGCRLITYGVTLLPGQSMLFRRGKGGGTNQICEASPSSGSAVSAEADSCVCCCASPGSNGAKAEPAVDKKSVAVDAVPTGKFKRLAPNALVLDTCRYRIGGKEWSERKPVWKVATEVLQAFGASNVFQRRYNSDIQWWKKWKVTPPITSDEVVELSFEFEVGAELKGDLKLVVEVPANYTATVNGTLVEPDGGSWLDPDFGTYAIKDRVVLGVNRITLSFPFREDIELENIYIIGDFGAYKNQSGPCPFILREEPAKLLTGPWTEQGYPFYAGKMTTEWQLTLPGDQRGVCTLELSNLPGAVARVRINGGDAGTVAWRPYALGPDEIGSLLKPGDNLVELTVSNTLRNLMGPHHYTGQHPVITGSFTWVDEGKWTDEYLFIPDGTPETMKLIFS